MGPLCEVAQVTEGGSEERYNTNKVVNFAFLRQQRLEYNDGV